MNVIAWTLAVTGGISFVASLGGVVCLLIAPEARMMSVETSLHDTYYVIAQSRMLLLPLLLCAALSAAIALIGYGSTLHYLRRGLPTPTEAVEQS